MRGSSVQGGPEGGGVKIFSSLVAFFNFLAHCEHLESKPVG